MEYFTAEEAEAIMNHSSVLLCTGWDFNPALKQARALDKHISASKACSRSPILAAAYGFSLGRATGIREERQRRKGAKKEAQA